jgi:hypothetical protein
MSTKNKIKKVEPLETLGGENPRHETAACPTGLNMVEQATAAQRPGGGGAPGTGVADAPQQVSRKDKTRKSRKGGRQQRA